MKAPKPKLDPIDAKALAQRRALRQAQRATNQRVDELKTRVLRFSEQHMDQAVRLIRRWLAAD